MRRTLIEAVQSTIYLTAYQERGEGYKIPTPILAKALQMKLDDVGCMPIEIIQPSDMLDMSEVLIELGKSLAITAESQSCHVYSD